MGEKKQEMRHNLERLVLHVCSEVLNLLCSLGLKQTLATLEILNV